MKIVASVWRGAGGVETPGGQGDQTGGDGRLVVGLNTTGLVPGGTSVAGAQTIAISQDGHHLGARGLNHHLYGGSTETPYIPGLADGADSFGLTSLSAADVDLAALLAGTPSAAAAALCLTDEGPASLAADWDGFDMLLMVNLSDRPLVAPMLGVGEAGYLMNLKQGGFTRDPLFGGSGDELLTELPAGAVYALLVPEGSTHFNMMASGCQFAHEESLGCGEAMYTVPEPATLGLLVLGGMALVARRRRRR